MKIACLVALVLAVLSLLPMPIPKASQSAEVAVQNNLSEFEEKAAHYLLVLLQDDGKDPERARMVRSYVENVLKITDKEDQKLILDQAAEFGRRMVPIHKAFTDENLAEYRKIELKEAIGTITRECSRALLQSRAVERLRLIKERIKSRGESQ